MKEDVAIAGDHGVRHSGAQSANIFEESVDEKVVLKGALPLSEVLRTSSSPYKTITWKSQKPERVEGKSDALLSYTLLKIVT